MKIWTDNEIAVLKERYPVEQNAVLREVFGVTPRQLTQKAFMLGVEKERPLGAPKIGRNHKAKVWTETEDAELRKWWPDISARVRGKNSDWLAKRLGVSIVQVRTRAATLGLRKQRKKEPPWTDREIEILDEFLHLHPKNIKARLKRRGYQRTEAAITVQRYRKLGGLALATGGYSAHQVASWMGVTTTAVLGWIRKGLLKATPRGDSKNQFDGPGDRWNITPKQIKAFVTDNAVLINPRGINFVWLIDILTNRV